MDKNRFEKLGPEEDYARGKGDKQQDEAKRSGQGQKHCLEEPALFPVLCFFLVSHARAP